MLRCAVLLSHACLAYFSTAIKNGWITVMNNKVKNLENPELFFYPGNMHLSKMVGRWLLWLKVNLVLLKSGLGVISNFPPVWYSPLCTMSSIQLFPCVYVGFGNKAIPMFVSVHRDQPQKDDELVNFLLVDCFPKVVQHIGQN